jgi:nickel/cobalt transporter (NicO) family protein
MLQIFAGSLLLSLIHALIPNHWLPIIAISRTEKWTRGQALSATVITGVAHTLSTIIIGVVVGLIGYKLSSIYSVISDKVAPLILVVLGIIYIIFDQRGHHHHDHEPGAKKMITGENHSRRFAILTSLSVAMFLTPCIEVEAYYFQAGTIGWTGIFTVSAVYLITTVFVMLLLVSLGLKGIRSFRSHFLEHHEKMITGSVLIILGILAMTVKF